MGFGVWEFPGLSAFQAGLGWTAVYPAGATSDSGHTEMAPGGAAAVYWLLEGATRHGTSAVKQVS